MTPSLKVLENIFSFNGCRVTQEEVSNDLALLVVSNEDETKRMIVVRDVNLDLATKLEGYEISDSDLIMILRRFDSFPVPAWIQVSELTSYIDKSIPIVPRLSTNPILGIDPAISDALSDKLDLIWGFD